jgi:hypothetical protein
MSERTIADIYADNDRIRQRLSETVGELSDEHASSAIDGEKWTIAQIVEHVSLVESGIIRICAKLLSKAEAEGTTAEGVVRMSDAFVERSGQIAAMKLEAPEIVHPSGKKTIAESLAKMEENRLAFGELMPAFEAFDSSENKFPHPFFGDLSAAEWLVLSGGHKARHIKQIRRLLQKM